MIDRPLLVGLTGGIGSGKSTVAKVFMALGIPVFNADDEARKIVNTDPGVIAQLEATFGQVYVDGKLDSKKLADIVFDDDQKLAQLNQIVHPRVGEVFNDWIAEHLDEPILLKEAAILIESGSHKDLDELILVIAPEADRINWVMNRDGVDRDRVRSRMEAQMSDADKLAYASYHISNNQRDMLIPQVITIFNSIKKKSGR